MASAERIALGRFRPSERRGRELAGALQRKLASSFAHLASACAPHVAFDGDGVRRQVEAIASAQRVRPELYVIHHDCREAAIGDDFAGVAAAFAALCETAVPGSPTLLRRNWADSGFSPEERARYQWAFGDEGDTTIRLTAAMPDVFDESCRSLDAALSALADADPELHGEILALVHEVVFAQGDPGAEMTFDGVTTVNAFGALVLNPAEHRTVAAAIAGLVHEAAHALLFAAGEGHSLVENPPQERYDSPLRPDPRPMNGIFHATFVSARMAYALDRVLSTNALAETCRVEAASLRAGARDAFWRGHAVFEAHGIPTPLGRAFMSGALDAMRA